MFSSKQRKEESLEQFYFVFSGLAARCSQGTLERRILRDNFFVNMTNKKAKIELCRATKTPDEIYEIALSYEKGDKYAKSYKFTKGGLTPAPAGAVYIRAKTNNSIEGGF